MISIGSKNFAPQLSEVSLTGYRHSGGCKAINPFVEYGVDSDELTTEALLFIWSHRTKMDE